MNIFCSLTKRRPTKDPTYRQKFTECLQPALTFSFQIRLKTKRIYIYIYTHNEGITLFFLSLESRSQRARQGVVEQDRSPRTRTTECARIYLSLYVTGMLSTVDYRGLPPRHDFPDQIQSHQTVQRYLVGPGPTGGLSVPDHDNNDKLVRSRVNLIEPMIKSTTVETLPRSSLPFDTSFLFFFNRYRELDRSLDLSKIFRC